MFRLRSDAARRALDGMILAADRAWLDAALSALDAIGDVKPRVISPNQGARNRGSRTAVVPIQGFLARRRDWILDMLGGTPTSEVGTYVDELAADDTVGRVILHVDSGGGEVAGIPELADKIYRARQRKPIIAAVDAYAGSAALWLASQASEVVITPSGSMGSHGVYSAHIDVSDADRQAGVRLTYISSTPEKVELSSHLPLSAEARAHEQGIVNSFYDRFTADLARGRKTTAANVKATYGRGRMLLAPDAVRVGMADRILPFDALLAEHGVTQASRITRLGASAERPGVSDVDIPAELALDMARVKLAELN